MAKPLIHSQSSVRKWKGKVNDYLPIHSWFDETKAFIADARHRSGRHHAQGIFECERVFGVTFVNSDGVTISTRNIAEQHILEDMGFIPTWQDYLENMVYQKWMNGIGLPKSHPKNCPKEGK